MPQIADYAWKFIRALRERGPMHAARKSLSHLGARWRRFLLHATTLRGRDPGKVFTRIYQSGFWGEKESASGPGSTLAFTTKLRAELPGLMRDLGVLSVLDAPCGDFNWARHVFPACGIDYIGGDIVAQLVEVNQKRFGGAAVRFQVLDITRTPFPDADLWICRDCLFHLPTQLIFDALRNFSNSSISFLLTSSHVRDFPITNTDIRAGDFRLLDLLGEPFGLPADFIAEIDDSHGGDTRRMVAWSRAQVRQALDDLNPLPA